MLKVELTKKMKEMKQLSTLVLALLALNVQGFSGTSSPSSIISTKAVSTSSKNNSLPTKQKDVCIVGGGPVGLATAILLSRPPHNYNCAVVESNADVATFNPGRGFMYNVNPRGRAFTKLFPQIDELLPSRGVESDFGRICVIPSDPSDPLPPIALKAGTSENDSGVDEELLNAGIREVIKQSRSGDEAYWIQRHELTALLREFCSKQKGEGNVEILSGVECIDVSPVPASASGDEIQTNDEVYNGGGVEMLVQDVSTKNLSKIQCNLVVGADGYNSKVRDLLSLRESSFNKHYPDVWTKIPRWKYQVKKFKSPATDLRIKVLLFPPEFPIPNNDGIEVKTNASYLYGIRSVNKGPTDSISLGILPIQSNNIMRPVNVIARPNHDIWKIKDPEELRNWFQKAFPRMKFGKENCLLPREEFERFIAEKGSQFPYCQYSNGVASSSVDKKSAVVLVGDALHAFPPDIGQGVNAGLADVVQLGKTLEDVNLSIKKTSLEKDKSNQILLGDAMKSFEKNRMSETKALIRLARFGSPYQYRQPLFIDKIGQKLWTMNVMLRVVLNKISFGLIPKPAIMIAFDHSLSFRQVMRKADSMTLLLGTLATWMLKKIFWKKIVLFL